MVLEDPVFQTYLVIFLWAFVGAVVGFTVSWALAPVNRAFLMRKLTKKNWGLIELAQPGGQVSLGVVLRDKPMIAYRGGQYTPDDDSTYYMGSIPVWVFNSKDTHGISLDVKSPTEKYRDPSAIESMFMIMKAMYEALANKQAAFLILLVEIAVGLALLGVIGALVNYGGINDVKSLAGLAAYQCGQVLNHTGYASQTLPNAIGFIAGSVG